MDGAERLRALEGPTLVLPNHPAYVDPALVLSHLRLGRALRPLVFSGIYRLLPLRPLMAMVDAFEVPDLSAQSRDAQHAAAVGHDVVSVPCRAGVEHLDV